MESPEISFKRFPNNITLAALGRVPLCTESEKNMHAAVSRSKPTKPPATQSQQSYEVNRLRPGLPASSLFLPPPDPDSPTPANRRNNIQAARRPPRPPPPGEDVDTLCYAYESLMDLYDGLDYFRCPSPDAPKPEAANHARPSAPEFVRASTVLDAMDLKRPPPPDGDLVPLNYHWLLHLGCTLLPYGPNCVCFDDACRAVLSLDAMGRHVIQQHRVQIQACCDFCPLTFITDDGIKRHVRDAAGHRGRSGEERRKLLQEFEGHSAVIQMRASCRNHRVSEVDEVEKELNAMFEQALQDRVLGKRPLKSRGKTPLPPPFRV